VYEYQDAAHRGLGNTALILSARVVRDEVGDRFRNFTAVGAELGKLVRLAPGAAEPAAEVIEHEIDILVRSMTRNDRGESTHLHRPKPAQHGSVAIGEPRIS
jgi:hypothetical protein